MNILHLEASSGWGGQEMRILREAQGLKTQGYQIFLAVCRGGLLVERARQEGFVVYELDFRKSRWPITLFQLLRILRRHRIDLVNTHSSLDGWIGGIAARLAGCAVVRTRHLSLPIRGGCNGRLLYGVLADFVVTTCSSIVPMVCQVSGKKREQCRMVATGVDPQKIRYAETEAIAFREELGLAPSDFLVGTACFMRSWKGIQDLLKAADLLREKRDLRWVIIGGGHEETYRKMARELQLEGIVHFTGHLDKPFAAIGALDLFILLSTANEGISQAILQAAYLQKPLLATPVGGLQEVCLDQITGIQVPPFSPEKVAHAVLQLKENPLLREEFGKRGKRLVEERFTFQQTLDAMKEIYEGLLI